ncbi:trypco2 family protein [Microbispora hainanensis]|uniref:trypco2 family protein n=1 Tax=Microbispora hainanensis TaxID=568844 RepID=UPI0033F2E057
MAVELAELIRQLRLELTEAMQAGEGEELRFELGPVEVELTVAVDKEAGSDAKVRFWVVELGAEGKVGSQATQRIALTLDPRLRGQPGRPVISGPERTGER